MGRGLIGRNAERYAREADLRFSLVRVNEHVDDISLAEGEADEKRRIELHLAQCACERRAASSWGTPISPGSPPALAGSPSSRPFWSPRPLYFNGKVSFGGLMMAAGAFTQAQSSLRWFIDNFSAIADWRATLLRVANFRHAVSVTHEPRGFESRIVYAEGEPGEISIETSRSSPPRTADMLKETSAVVKSGERVLILGAPGTGKTQLFRAMAGLWPWGSGRITRPQGEQIFYLPRGIPYMPRGSLREVLAYPLKAESFGESAFARALYRLGLERLAPLFDTTRRWDRELSQDEQLCLAVARILLHNPTLGAHRRHLRLAR